MVPTITSLSQKCKVLTNISGVAMELSKVIQILQLGFSGFAFLMAGLSYRLLVIEQKRSDNPRKTILSAVRNYMGYTIALCILVLGGTFLEKYLNNSIEIEKDKRLIASKDAIACAESIDRLLNAGLKTASDYTSLEKEIAYSLPGCQTIMNRISDLKDK
jgi:hypothetical protein